MLSLDKLNSLIGFRLILYLDNNVSIEIYEFVDISSAEKLWKIIKNEIVRGFKRFSRFTILPVFYELRNLLQINPFTENVHKNRQSVNLHYIASHNNEVIM